MFLWDQNFIYLISNLDISYCPFPVISMWLCRRVNQQHIDVHYSIQVASGYPFGHLYKNPWWRHHMEIFFALLALCAGNSPVTGEFPTQRPVTRRFDVFFHLCLNKQSSKQSWGWWFKTPSRSLWRHCNAVEMIFVYVEIRLSGYYS